MTDDRYTRGLATLQETGGDAALRVVEALADTAPDLGRFLVEFGYGDIASRPGLDARQRAIVAITGLVTIGDSAEPLAVHVGAALRAGLRPEQVVELMMHAVPFIGFARVLRAVTLTRQTFAALGATVRPIVARSADDRFEHGLELMRRIAGEGSLGVLDSLGDIAPDMGRQIVEFTYADNYARPGLDVRERLLVTISALISLGDTALPLGVQMRAAVNNGLSRAEVVETILALVPHIGFARALAAAGVARTALG